ncbi:ABC-type amino acid transport system, permease component [Marinomonas sp. MED121]|uniref:amino acid ABC transporter permease n=1 Tax=Marinomonas sp. MED121 TaxID=314277 RepID=UPI000068FB66|nr:amino acid ABC transporter permease [Marinomonas sp. MED121]EAQ65026.1 ABC-type amino acid transport system, permease component [Marinomonas sp. MED121]
MATHKTLSKVNLTPPESRARPQNKMTLLQKARQRYFSNLLNSFLTLSVIIAFILILPPLLQWAIFDAVFIGSTQEACEVAAGACWLPIAARFDLFVYGFYPETETWRVNLVFAASFFTLVVLVWRRISMKLKLVYIVAFLPALIFVLLYGGVFGLDSVSSNKFGGLIITIFLGLIGSILSLPLGIFLALGRRSTRPVIRIFCVSVIELFRAMPMITWLFMGALVLQLFLPNGMEVDKMIRVVFILVLVSAASKAEIIRAGLQAIPVGQFEASAALGVGYWRTMSMVIMPQVLKVSIPAMLNSFIGMFKDTSLVAIIGLLDFLSVGMATMNSDEWGKYGIEVYIFVAMIYFVILFTISRFSLTLEKQLETGH